MIPVETVRRAQRGDDVAFTLLVRDLQDLAVGFAYARVGDYHTAEDVAQEAFLDVHRLLPSLREPAAFVVWLRRILVKHCDRVTRRGTWHAERVVEGRGTDVIAAVVDPHPDALETMLAAERERLAHAAVAALPEHLRTVVSLYYLGDRSVAQIAAFLDVPAGTVKSRLSAARVRIQALTEMLIEDTMHAHRPSRDDTFEQRVRQMLTAAADGDTSVLARLLAEDAALAGASGPHPFWGGIPQPLQVAAEWGRTDAVRMLLDAGVDPDARPAEGGYDDWSALQLALYKGHRETAELLIAHGATVDAWSAALLGDTTVLQSLLDDDPALVHAAGPSRATPLHFASTAAVAELLIARGADPAAIGHGGWTPMQSAAFAGRQRRDAARWLLTRYGGLDLFIAAALDEPAEVRRLISDGNAIPDERSVQVDAATHADGATPLHVAASLGNLAAVRVLLELGADPNARTALGHQPLHFAAQSGSRDVVEALLAAGAARDTRDGEHDATPAAWADFFGHDTLRDRLAGPEGRTAE